MSDLDSLLERPGLDVETRHLVLAKLAVWPADWGRLTDVARSARDADIDRDLLAETLLQGTLFFGFPRTVSAFETLTGAWPGPTPSGGGLPAEQQTASGRRLFASIYGRNDQLVRSKLAAFHQEFHDFVLEAAYGRILTRPLLSGRTRELLAVAALAAMGQIPQLVAHGRGALALGASAEEVREALFCVNQDHQECDRWFRRIG